MLIHSYLLRHLHPLLSIFQFISISQQLSRSRKMSCCGGNCGCGSGCKCGSGCGGCKMYPDMSFSEQTSTETLIVGVAPQKTFFEGSEMGVAAENGCKCGANCQCDPCTCK